MKVRPFKETSLWKRTLAPQKKCPHNALRANLALEYEKFRERAADLTNEIHALLPNLTVHNVEHLDALWDVASSIAGDEYPINPLEAFVLGGAILTHDAGMALAAFPGRMAEIMRHDRWKEHEKAAWRRRSVDDQPTAEQLRSMGDEVRHEAAFDIVRAEHAKQAEKLVSFTWQKAGEPQPMALLPDDPLRQSYGVLIGQIAASHHWGVGDLTRKLPNGPVPAAHPYPKTWNIDAIKIACLLRCADAANIDETRAPSFVYAMRRPDKVSREHWEFQNRLLPAEPDGDALVFSCKKPFEEGESATWWLCRETVKMCSEQLEQTDSLLKDEGRPPFAIRRVKGADDPRRLAETVTVSGWTPVDTTVKVTDVMHLVGSLGGEQLYGDAPLVPLRELIQNAADAIRARRKVDPDYYIEEKEQHRRGRITIRIEDDNGPDGDPEKFWLIVEDDGVGMRERVMTGPLLDFGTSFWRSPMAGEEFPGLLVGDDFAPTGKFGIGFYSVFMYADRVRVTSRRANPEVGGYESAKTLEFKDGLTRRALIRAYRKADDGNLPSSVSTRVSIRIPRSTVDEWTLHNRIKIANRLQWLVLGLNVTVTLITPSESGEIHTGSYESFAADDFLRRLLSAPETDEVEAFVDEISPKLTSITDKDGVCYGRAALFKRDLPYVATFRNDSQVGITVGGLTCDIASYSWPTLYCIGLFRGEPISAARNAGRPHVPEETLALWAQSQCDRHPDPTAEESAFFARALLSIGSDPGNLTAFIIGNITLSTNSLIEHAKREKRILFSLVETLSRRLSDEQPTIANVGLPFNFKIMRQFGNKAFALAADDASISWSTEIVRGILPHQSLAVNWSDYFSITPIPEEHSEDNTLTSNLLEKLRDDGCELEFITHDDYVIGHLAGEPVLHKVIEIRIK